MLDRGISWNFIYVILAGLGVCLLSLCLIAFRHDSPDVYILSIARPFCESEVKCSAVGDALRNRLVILLSLTVLLYVGGEVGSGSWMTTYMINVRHGSRDSMGYVSTGYWAGLTLGRVGFSFLNARLSRYLEFLFIFYLGCAMLFCILAWTIPIIIVSAVAVAFLGMFLGPIFPTMVGVAVRKLPRRLHVSGIGFAATFGGAGAAAIPFVIGVVTDTAGAKVIPPTILAFLIAAMVIWVTIIKFC
jgi:fucose permease